MLIDQYNYEEYLLRYVDGELDAAEQAAMQSFLLQHPFAQEELEWLQASQLQPDENLHFEPKINLYHGATDALANQSNWEERLLRCLDDELSAEEAAALMTYADKHPTLLREWALLQHTKLLPDSAVVFEHKNLLYRQNARLRPLRRLRVAVAAAIAALFVLYSSLVHFDRAQKQAPPPVASSNAPTSLPQVAPKPLSAEQKKNLALQASSVAKKSSPAVSPSHRIPPASQDRGNLQPVQQPALTSLAQQEEQSSAASFSVVAPPPIPAVDDQKVPSISNFPAPAMEEKKDPAVNFSGTPSPAVGKLILSSESQMVTKVVDKLTRLAKIFSRKKKENGTEYIQVGNVELALIPKADDHKENQ